MRKIIRCNIILFLAVLNASILNSQKTNFDLKVTQSEEIKMKKEGLIFVEETQILGFCTDSFNNYHLMKSVPAPKSSYNMLVLDSYRPDLKLLNSRTVDLPAQQDGPVNLVGLFPINHKPLLFYSQNDKKKEQNSLYFVNLLNEKEKPTRLMVDKSDQSSSFFEGLPSPLQENNATRDFNIFFSSDSSKIMVLSNPVAKLKELVRVKCIIFTNELKKLQEYDIELDVTKKKFFIQEWFVTNQGYPCVFLVKPRVDKRKEFGKKQKELLLFKTNTPIVFNLDLKDKYIKTLTSGHEENNEITLIGTYGVTKNEKNGSICGSYFLKLNTETKKVTTMKLNQFNNALFDFIGVQIKDIEKGYGFFEYKPILLTKTPNQNSVLVLDQRFFTIYTNGKTTVVDYYTNSKLVISYDKNGNKVYDALIPNATTSRENRGMISHALVQGNSIGIVYNTNRKNNIKIAEKSMKKSSDIELLKIDGFFKSKTADNVINFASIDEKGKISYRTIQNEKDDRIMLADAKATNQNNNFIFAVHDVKEYRVIKCEIVNAK